MQSIIFHNCVDFQVGQMGHRLNEAIDFCISKIKKVWKLGDINALPK